MHTGAAIIFHEGKGLPACLWRDVISQNKEVDKNVLFGNPSCQQPFFSAFDRGPGLYLSWSRNWNLVKSLYQPGGREPYYELESNLNFFLIAAADLRQVQTKWDNSWISCLICLALYILDQWGVFFHISACLLLSVLVHAWSENMMDVYFFAPSPLHNE